MVSDPIARTLAGGSLPSLGCPPAEGQAVGLLSEESTSTAEERAGTQLAVDTVS